MHPHKYVPDISWATVCHVWNIIILKNYLLLTFHSNLIGCLFFFFFLNKIWQPYAKRLADWLLKLKGL